MSEMCCIICHNRNFKKLLLEMWYLAPVITFYFGNILHIAKV